VRQLFCLLGGQSWSEYEQKTQQSPSPAGRLRSCIRSPTPSIVNEVTANFLRVLWHPARVRILELLREEDRELADQQEILQDLEPS
jgi:hypothetical protein